jgi:enamine deaminase RidA (YjgF/YER057c/UK114 family)
MSPRTQSLLAEERIRELGIVLPRPPQPLGAYTEVVQTGNLLFLSGTLPIDAGVPRYRGRIGDDLNIEDGEHAARLAALNAVSLAKEYLGSLNRVQRVVRLGVSVVTTPEFRDHPRVADGASELLVAVFGPEKIPTRLVIGVHSLPLSLCVETEVIFEVTG